MYTKTKLFNYVWLALFVISTFSFLSGCTPKPGTSTEGIVGCAAESAAAFVEEPSMELVLDRLNTAAAAADIAHTCFNEVPIAAESTWPKDLKTIRKEDIKAIITVLASDGAYQAHGGVVSPIKAHIAIAQNVLYELPPDLYSPVGSCYEDGEETIINGVYYKIILPHGKKKLRIIKKEHPSLEEIKSAVKQYAANIVKSGKCINKNSILKRKGVLKKQTGSNVYQGLMAALFDILPNGQDIRAAYDEYNEVNQKVMALNDEISGLNKDKTRLKNKKKPVGKLKTLEAVEEALKEKKAQLKQLKEELKEKSNILSAELDKISEHKGEITDPEALKVLENVAEACGAVKNFLLEAGCLTTIAIAKAPRSLIALPSELQQLANPSQSGNTSLMGGLMSSLTGGGSGVGQAIQMAYMPLRLARLRYNAGNLVDNIKLIGSVISNDVSLLTTIHSEISELLDIETAKEAPEEGGKNKKE